MKNMYPDTTKLAHSYIYRAGATAPYLRCEKTASGEDAEVTFAVNEKNKSLEFRFNLSAAGGGTTEVLLRLDLRDFPLILSGMEQLRTQELTRLRQAIDAFESLERASRLRAQAAQLESRNGGGVVV